MDSKYIYIENFVTYIFLRIVWPCTLNDICKHSQDVWIQIFEVNWVTWVMTYCDWPASIIICFALTIFNVFLITTIMIPIVFGMKQYLDIWDVHCKYQDSSTNGALRVGQKLSNIDYNFQKASFQLLICEKS